MSFFAWLILLLCFLSFGLGFIVLFAIQYGPFMVLLFLGLTVYVPYKMSHKSSPVLLDDRVDAERRELALQRHLKVVKKQDVEN